MFRTLSVLLLATVLSWGLLWFVLPLDWLHASPTAVLTVHVLPPLLLTLADALWQRRLAAREQAAAQQQAQQAAAEQQQACEAARRQHEQQLAARQQAVHCRWLWLATPAAPTPAPWLDSLDGSVYWQTLAAPDAYSSSALDYQQAAAVDALQRLYQDFPGLSGLPVLLQPVAQPSNGEYLQQWRHWQQTAWQQACPQQPLPAGDYRFLSAGRDLCQQVLSCWQQDPALPGVLVWAADAPCLAAVPGEDGEPDVAVRPAAAMILMLLLRSDLPAPMPPAEAAAAANPYQPYWSRPPGPCDAAAWGQVPPALQTALQQQALHVCLAQAAQGEVAGPGTLQLSRSLQPLLEAALLNAALLDEPLTPAQEKPAAPRLQALAWLVHRCGVRAGGGMRLAALASLLPRHGIDLNPVADASDAVREWGECGSAGTLLLTALAIVHAHRLQAPVLSADFPAGQATLAVAYPALVEEDA